MPERERSPFEYDPRRDGAWYFLSLFPWWWLPVMIAMLTILAIGLILYA